MVKKRRLTPITKHWVCLLLHKWVRHSNPRAQLEIGLAMLSEKLSGRRIHLHPEVRWHRVTAHLPIVGWLEDNIEKFPNSFRAWLESGDAFEEISPERCSPTIRALLPRLRVEPREIVDLLNESPRKALQPDEYRQRSYVWWHLSGMPTDLLAELVNKTQVEVECDLIEGFQVLLNQIGFCLFAYRVDIACVLGGDLDIPYLKRLLVAKGYAQRPLYMDNVSWRKYLPSGYYNDPSLLRQVGGTSPPRESTALIRTRPWRMARGPDKEVKA